MLPDIEHPDITRRLAERNELMRIAAQRLVDHKVAGRRVDPEGLKWAQGIVARFKPLGRALSDGTPAQGESR